MDRLIIFILFFICQAANFVSSLWLMACVVVGSDDRAWRIIRAYDRLANAATGGTDRETISSRAYRGTLEKNRGWCILCKLLDRLEKNHCQKSAGV